MTDDFANNVIPWHFYNTKTLEDAQSLSTVKDQAELERKITARRGWVTKGLNRIELDKKYHEQFKIQGKESPTYIPISDSAITYLKHHLTFT